MKRYLITMIQYLVKSDVVWYLLDNSLIKVSRRLEWERNPPVPNANNQGFIEECIEKSFPDLKVKHGIFSGLMYPGKKSYGSVLFPKLLGSYEKELESIWEHIIHQQYDVVVDIGCAEGFYTIGCALKMPKAKVFCFDTSECARELCHEMAEFNNVQTRIEVASVCTKEILRNITAKCRSLIICDCEGCEHDLFTSDAAEFLSQHDMLIETHDFLNLDISIKIKEIYSQTHDIITISSIDDIKKAQTYNYEELKNYSIAQRYELLREGRPAIMDWLFLRSNRTDSIGLL